MKPRLVAATLFIYAAAMHQAGAQTLKPGLWEMRQSAPGGAGEAMAEQMAQMMKQLAAMPPEQRKQMEAMMAANNHNDVRFTDEGITLKACITSEQTARLEKLVIRDGNCTNQRSPMVAGVVKINFSCTSPPSTGNGTIRFQGDSGFQMAMTMSANVQGQTRTTTITTDGKWLDTNCGKIKPAPALAPAR